MIASLIWILWPTLYALGAMGVGWAASTNESVTLLILSIIGGCLLPLRGIWYILLARKKGTPLRARMLAQTLIELLLVPVIVFLPRLSYDLFVAFLILYTSFYTGMQTVNAVVYRRNRVISNFIPALSQALLFGHLFVALLVLPADIRRSFVMSLSGFLLSVLGHSYLCDWLATTIKSKEVAQVFRRISLTLPAFIGLGVPSRLLDTLRHQDDVFATDAQILFNYGRGGLGIAGHCELCIDGRTYTYGNYDPSSRAVFKTMGNGILFRAERERYLSRLCAEGRTVVAFGLTLPPEQLAALRQSLAHFHETLVPWEAEARNTPPGEYIHRMANTLCPEIYRVTDGRFKTYFLPTINCVTLTAYLLQATDAGNLIGSDIYTPGAYMDAIYRLYCTDNSTVTALCTFTAARKENTEA